MSFFVFILYFIGVICEKIIVKSREYEKKIKKEDGHVGGAFGMEVQTVCTNLLLQTFLK